MSRRPVQVRDDLRYLRREGNRKVRAQRRRRSAIRIALGLTIGALCTAASVAGVVAGVRWVLSPDHFRVETIEVRGAQEAAPAEIAALADPWKGRNLFEVPLDEVERKVREHPWIGSGGRVRIDRRLPGRLVITVREREAAGLALVDGMVFLLDSGGLPIARFGPEHAGYDFPIIKGIDDVAQGPGRDEARLREALATGVDVARTLAQNEPVFYDQVSEIDMSQPGMVVLRLEDERYDLRLSRADYLQNLHRYFALKGQIKDAEQGDIEYVDLRWQDRIAVMPAAAIVESHGGR